ncbi:hypothetical protein HW555_005456 [Spodoptera exigua]|uniref:Endonuclease-reverse transcriptase n=1 Tax=Spodoptera exigua TaxID=7107 RepID=A0A835GJT2_SPOEX|nr:hypothetical protein HW555_005456 [Spodoptera exigua]
MLKMDEQFQLLFEKMKIEMQNQAVSISNTIMDRIDEKLKPVLEENKKLILKVENLEKKIEFLERDKKGNNIIIYGLKEGEKSTRELIENAKNKFQKELNLVLEDYDINKIHPFGKPNKDDKPRPPKKQQTASFSRNNRTNAFDVMRNRSNSLTTYLTDKK